MISSTLYKEQSGCIISAVLTRMPLNELLNALITLKENKPLVWKCLNGSAFCFLLSFFYVLILCV